MPVTDRIDDDATSDALQDDDGITGSLTPDSGYLKVKFRNATKINELWSRQIEKTLADYIDIDARRKANLDAHEGLPTMGEMIVINTTKRNTNQQAAWFLQALLSKKPIMTTKALEVGKIELLIPNEQGAIEPTEFTFEEEAEALQALTDFYLENKVDFRSELRTVIDDAVRDQNRPPIFKVIHEDRTDQQPKQGMQNLRPFAGDESGRLREIVIDPMLGEVKDGCPTRLVAIPPERFFLPPPYSDVQTAPFCFQEYELDTATVKSNLANGKWDLAGALDDPDVDADSIIQQIVARASTPEELDMLRRDGRHANDPTATHRMFELWFFMPFAAEETQAPALPATQLEAAEPAVEPLPAPKPKFEWRSLCATVHWPSRRIMVCIDNPWWTKRRPFFPIYTKKRPHSFAGVSGTEDGAALQNLISQLYHLGLQNKIIRNTCVFPVKIGSPTWTQLNAPGYKLRPGNIVGFRNKDDFMAVPMGSPIESLSDEISLLLAEDEKMSVVTSTDRGQVPNRTPNQTVQSVESLAKMQPATQLDLIRECIAPAVKFYVQALIQYNTQLVIPFRNPVTSALIARVINFPMIQVTEQFAWSVTATADDLTDEALFNQSTLLSSQVIVPFNDRVMLMAKGGWSPLPAAPPMPGMPPSPPQMPPAPIIEMTTNMILGERRMAARALRHAKVSPDDYLLTEAFIRGMPLMLAKSLQIAQTPPPGGSPDGQQQQIPAANPGAAVPGAEGGATPPPAMGGQPGNGNPAGGVTPGGPPPPFGGA